MPKTKLFRLERVHYMPKTLEPGVLYVSETFGAAAHLCACGCGAKIRTPLGLTEWQLEDSAEGPSLRPSVGNWQQLCRSHYWIWKGTVEWCGDWTEEQVKAGRLREHQRRKKYFSERDRQRRSKFRSIGRRIWGAIKNFLSNR